MTKRSAQISALVSRCACALLLALPSAHAQTVPTKTETKPWWITVGGFSYHFANRDMLNQTHPGLGLEYHLSDELALVAGGYKNSNYHWSQYAGANWMPLQYGAFKLGATAQIANHYDQANNGGIFAFAAPTLSVTTHKVGVNVYVIPTIAKVTGAVAVQFKFQF
jgi:hypothetical protein